MPGSPHDTPNLPSEVSYHSTQLDAQTGSPIEKLPFELMAETLFLAVPPLNADTMKSGNAGKAHMQALAALQRVSKGWNIIVEGTPLLWALLSSEFSRAQNIINLEKSRNHPLTIYFHKARDSSTELCTQFLSIIGGVSHRWRTVWLVNLDSDSELSQILSKPAPLLELLRIRCRIPTNDHRESLALFSYQYPRLRHLTLSLVAPHPDSSPFTNLTNLFLKSTCVRPVNLRWLMEVLRRSPHLERLSLAWLEFHIPKDLPSMPTVNLDHLKQVDIEAIEGGVVEYIVCRLKAPNCDSFSLIIDDEEASNYDCSAMLESGLTSFEPVLRKMSQRAKSTWYMCIGMDGFYWGNPRSGQDNSAPSFKLDLDNTSFISMVRWADRVVLLPESGRYDGLLYIEADTPLADDEIVSCIKRLQCVTRIAISEAKEKTLQVLQMLGDVGAEPVLPSLRELELYQQPGYWSGRDLLQMIQARFSQRGHPYHALKISVQRRIYHDYVPSYPKVTFNFDTLRQIKSEEKVDIVFPSGVEDI